MCIYITIYRYNLDKYDFVEKDDYLIKKSYQIGNGLQLVNMARDLVYDSESWGRCYFPTEFMEDKKKDIEVLSQEKNPRSTGETKLRKYAQIMIKLADGLVGTIFSSSIFPNKPKLTKYNKFMILFKTSYIKSMLYVI